MNLKEFMSDDNHFKNAWLTERGFDSFYVRKGRMIFHRLNDLRDKPHDTAKTIQLANIVAKRPGKGTFTRLVKRLRKTYPEYTLYVENANPRFSEHLRRTGWEETTPGYCFILTP